MAATSEETGRRFVDALHALDRHENAAAERIAQLFADDARLTNPMLRRSGEVRAGRDGVRQFWEEYARTFGAARTEFRAMTTGAREVGLFWTTRGTLPDGGPVEYDGASLLVLDRDGRIALFSGYFDPAELTMALDRAATDAATHERAGPAR
jgi:ketosteroid isomerase-like protein